MKSAVWVVVVMFAAVFGVFVLGRGGLTGEATGTVFSVANSTVLSVIAGVIAIGVLIVAGLQQSRN